MNKEGYAVECTECGSRDIKRGEPTHNITTKESTVLFICLDCGNEKLINI